MMEARADAPAAGPIPAGIRIARVCLLALCTACGRSGGPRPLAAPCGVAGLDASGSRWQEVRATGFRFCVPPDWSERRSAGDSVAAQSWAGRGGSLRWGLGRPRSMIGPGVEMAITAPVVPPGESPPPSTSGTATPRRLQVSGCEPGTRALYQIGMLTLVVTQIACNGTWTVTAWSTDPEIYLQGESRSADGARRLLAMMLTIRLTS